MFPSQNINSLLLPAKLNHFKNHQKYFCSVKKGLDYWYELARPLNSGKRLVPRTHFTYFSYQVAKGEKKVIWSLPGKSFFCFPEDNLGSVSVSPIFFVRKKWVLFAEPRREVCRSRSFSTDGESLVQPRNSLKRPDLARAGHSGFFWLTNFPILDLPSFIATEFLVQALIKTCKMFLPVASLLGLL